MNLGGQLRDKNFGLDLLMCAFFITLYSCLEGAWIVSITFSLSRRNFDRVAY